MTVAMGYKWNTANEYASAADLGNTTSKTESGLACNTTYTRYVWSYNSCGKSPANPLTQTTIQNSPVGFHRGIRQSGMCRSFSHFFNHCNQWRYITGIPMESKRFGYFGRNWRKICLFPANNDAVTCGLTSNLLCATLCDMYCDGSVTTISTFGGTPPYTYFWQEPTGFSASPGGFLLSSSQAMPGDGSCDTTVAIWEASVAWIKVKAFLFVAYRIFKTIWGMVQAPPTQTTLSLLCWHITAHTGLMRWIPLLL